MGYLGIFNHPARTRDANAFRIVMVVVKSTGHGCWVLTDNRKGKA